MRTCIVSSHSNYSDSLQIFPALSESLDSLVCLVWTAQCSVSIVSFREIFYQRDFGSEWTKHWSFSEGVYMPSWMKFQVFLPLFLLQCLNLYWYYLIFQILVRYVFYVYIVSRSGTTLPVGLSYTTTLMINARTMRGTMTILKIRKRIKPVQKPARFYFIFRIFTCLACPCK